jgi:hypothetical protein
MPADRQIPPAADRNGVSAQRGLRCTKATDSERHARCLTLPLNTAAMLFSPLLRFVSVSGIALKIPQCYFLSATTGASAFRICAAITASVMCRHALEQLARLRTRGLGAGIGRRWFCGFRISPFGSPPSLYVQGKESHGDRVQIGQYNADRAVEYGVALAGFHQRFFLLHDPQLKPPRLRKRGVGGCSGRRWSLTS